MNLKRTFLILLVVLVGSTFVGSLMMKDTGYIRISYMNYLIETSLWFALFLFIVFLIALWLLGYIVRKTFDTPAVVNQWARKKGRQSAHEKTEKGMLEYVEGNWGKAQRHLLRGANRSEYPVINYLTAARAASEQGDIEETELLLDKAQESTPQAKLAVGLTRARLEIANDQFEKGLVTLKKLKEDSPDHPSVLKLLCTAYEKVGDWQALAGLIPELRRRKRVFPLNELLEKEKLAWVNLFQKAAEEVAGTPGDTKTLEPLTAVWDRLPGSLTNNSDIIVAYARHLSLLGAMDKAETLVRKALGQNWSDALVELYGRLSGNNAQEQLKAAEKWLLAHPDNAQLLLALGRLSLRVHDWDKARNYFESSLKVERNLEALGELCRLYIHLGNQEKGNHYLVSGVVAQLALPDLPMPVKSIPQG
ncbi:MAG: heme biosynthesis protein HemY [Proteobacteria bacterium]|nr:MAG: heme biosynthesis protein HemY [Pseudomonadota bacterium]